MRLGDSVLYEGVVEDRKDPDQLGRVRVRIFKLHTEDKTKLPTEALPWSLPVQDITSAANSGIGHSPTGIVEGTWVVGYFRDGKDQQQFVVLGTIAGIPTEAPNKNIGFNDPNENYPRTPGESDVNSLARGESGNLVDDHNALLVREVPIAGNWGSWSEPALTYSAEYPFDHVRETESGHIEEFDDTPKAERIHRRHRTGTGYEIMPDGSKAERIVKDNYEVVLGNDNIYVKGNVNISTSEHCNVYAGKSINLDAQTDINIKAGNDINIQAGNNITTFAGTDVLTAAGSHAKIQAGATFIAYANARADMWAASVHLKSAGAQNPNIARPLDDVPSLSVQDEITRQTEAFLISIEGSNSPIDAEFTSNTPVSESIFSVGEEIPVVVAPGQVPETEPAIVTKVDQNPAPPPAVIVPTACTGIVVPPIDYNMQLSTRFKLKHLTSDCTFKHFIPNDGWEGLTAAEIICNLKALAVNVLEPLADQYPGFRINCAFRKQTGNSQHRYGMAADLQYPSKTVGFEFEVAKWIKDNLPFDQLIFEHGNSAWIHVSYNRLGNRKTGARVLSYKPEGWKDGRQYTSGIILAYPENVRVSPGGTTFA